MKTLLLSKIQATTLCTVILGGLIMPKNTFAQYYSTTQNKDNIVIDKQISADGGKSYFDNISASTKTFTEGNQISFRIVVENKGEERLTDIKFVDYLPKHLSLLFYPGVLNKTNNTIEFTIPSMEPGEKKAYLVVAMVKDLPVGTNPEYLMQLTNKACVSNDRTSDCDSAKYFTNIKSSPKTGSSDIAINSVILTLTLAMGALLRKKVRGF